MSPLLLLLFLKYFTQIRAYHDTGVISHQFIPEEIPPLVYMQISEDTYNSSCQICESPYLNYGIKAMYEKDDRTTGFQGRTYLVTNLKTNYSQAVIAFRGSDDLSDVVSDVFIAAGITTRQFEVAQRYFQEAYSMFSFEYEITLTGHSLGGCFAYVEARKTNNLAIIFDTPGCEALVPETAPEESCSLITRYAKFPNLINGFGKSCGDLFRISECDELELNDFPQYWKNSHESLHLGLVLATSFGLNLLWIIGSYLGFYFANKEALSLFKGHILLRFEDSFDPSTGYPLQYQKINPDTWLPLITGYQCSFKADNFNESLLNKTRQSSSRSRSQTERPKNYLP